MPTSVRFGRSASVVAVTVVLIGGAYGVSQAAASRLSGTLAAPLAFADDEWYPEYFDNINAINHSDLYEPLASVRVKQARTTHINVVDGKRVTWTPPPCSCRRVRVWVYGGSTTWGVGQRDGHTIPSELARAAWADGVALEVENRGVGGDAHWEEAQRFAWDLAERTATGSGDLLRRHQRGPERPGGPRPARAAEPGAAAVLEGISRTIPQSRPRRSGRPRVHSARGHVGEGVGRANRRALRAVTANHRGARDPVRRSGGVLLAAVDRTSRADRGRARRRWARVGPGTIRRDAGDHRVRGCTI